MSATLPLTRHECNSQCISIQCILALIVQNALYLSHVSHHPLIGNLANVLTHSPHTPIDFSIIWMPSFLTQTLRQEYNYVVCISVRKKVAVQALFKGRKILLFVWYITFPYPYFAISNHVMVSYMTSFLGIHSYNKFLSFISLVITS
jgi:hypothetical protein